MLIDAFLPVDGEQADRFWRALDRDVERAGSAPTVVLTTRRHAWSAAAVRARYEGARVLAPDSAHEETLAATPVDVWFAAGDTLPTRITAHASGQEGEVVLWVEAHRTLVVGNVLVGDGGGIAHGEGTIPGLAPAAVTAPALRPLLALPVERILPGHGAPVLESGAAALAALLAG